MQNWITDFCNLQSEIWASELQRLQVVTKFAAQVLALEGEFYRGLQESQLVAGVVALAFVDVRIHFLFFEQDAHAVGELEFASRARGSLGQAVEDRGREDVASDYSQVRRGFLELRLLDHVANFE